MYMMRVLITIVFIIVLWLKVPRKTTEQYKMGDHIKNTQIN